MAILTLSYSAQSSSAPTQSGWNAFKVDFEGTYTFTVADLTTDTNPAYVGNTFYSTKIVTLPSKGTLQLSGSAISAGNEILSTDIALGLFVYVAESDVAGYTDSSCTFLVADEDSLSYNNTANDLIFTAASDENEPPDSVGVITINLSNPETHTFTPENFTTETTPVYSDPEGDDAYAVKITSIPFYGTLYYGNVELSLNDSILIEDIDSGLFTYVTDDTQESDTSETITFSVSDKGSYEFTSGGVVTMNVEAYVGSEPRINKETNVYVELNNDYTFTRYDLVTAAGYSDADGDTAEAIRFTSLPSSGEVQLDGVPVSAAQEISLDDVDSGLLIYYTVDDTLGGFEMEYQVKDSSGEWSITSINTLTITSGSVGISLNENSGAGQVVYTIVVGDNTGVVNYAISGADAGLLTLTGNVVTLNVNPDFDTKSSYSFNAIASDEAGDATTKTITFSILDVDEVNPIITSLSTGINLDDASGAGQTIYTITATDDIGVVSYAISGTDASLLSVNSSTGVVTLIANPDYDTKSSYSFDVTASDEAGNVDTKTITFSILDVYIFDSYPPLYAWFFNEKLTTNSSNIYDIRRDIDNEITTVSFSSENEFNLQCTVSDGSTLAQWIGNNNGFITKAYDQMGSGLDAVQLNTARQIQIISSGNLILENNSPAGLFNGAKNYKITNYNPQNLTSLLILMLISEDTTSTNTVAEVLAETTSNYTVGSGGFLLYQNLSSNTHNIRFATENGNGDSTLVSNTKMLSFYTDLASGSGGFSDEMLTFINNNPIVTNGQSDSSIAFSIADLYIGARGDSASIGYQGTVHGFSIFNGNQLPNRRKIESHFQSSFPNIFGQPDVLGSGNVSVLSQMDANIVFDGNSLTEGINGSGVDQYFPKKVRDYLIPKCVSVEFHGLGVSGYKMTQMRDNFDTRILPLVNANKTNILIFGEDANDVLGGHVTGQQNFDLAVEYAQKAKNAGYNQVILWTGWYPRTAQQSVAIMDEQHNYFELVKSANINTVPWDAVVDMRDNNAFRWGKLPYATPLTQAELDEQATYFADYLHLKALGYDKASEEIINEGILNLNTL